MSLLSNSFPLYSDDSNRNNFIEPPTGIIEDITMASISSFIQLVLPETQSDLSIGGGNSESQKGWNNKKKDDCTKIFLSYSHNSTSLHFIKEKGIVPI